jgi:hypothetical protein
MYENFSIWFPAPDGCRQRLQNQVRGLTPLHGPPNNTPREEVNYNGQIGKAFISALAERSLQPCVKSTGMDAKHPAHDMDTELGTMRLDDRVPHFSSLTK